MYRLGFFILEVSMAFNFPSLAELVNRTKTSIKNALPNSNPFLRNSFLSAMATAIALRVGDINFQLDKDIIPEFFIISAKKLSSVLLFGQPFGISQGAAVQSTGLITGTGTIGDIVPSDTSFQDSSGLIFISTADATVINTNLIVSTLTQAGGIATATVPLHGFFSDLDVTISGVVQSEYNGTFSITVTDEDTFLFTVDSGAVSPATGVTILASATIISVSVTSEEFGENQNLEGGDQLIITSPILNIDDDFFIQHPGLENGQDLETIEEIKAEVTDRYTNPSANFTPSDIRRAIQLDRDNTRVFVFDITPAVGQVTAYFVRDNDGDGTAIIPGANEVARALDNVLNIKPSTVSASNVFVLAPTPLIINFTFSFIDPSSDIMQTAIFNSLKQFFQDDTSVGQIIKEIGYQAAIINTVDSTGLKLLNFTLTTPIGDINTSTGELPVLGSVTFV